jgi:peptidoglycan/LPS O-acetylase OafA/YrhL
MCLHSTPSRFDPIAVPSKGTLLALFFGNLIYLSSWAKRPEVIGALLRFRILRELGKYSYGLYVFHVIVAYWAREAQIVHSIERLGLHPTLALFVLALGGMVVSYVIAYASYELFEARFLELKRLFESGVRAHVSRDRTVESAGSHQVA